MPAKYLNCPECNEPFVKVYFIGYDMFGHLHYVCHNCLTEIMTCRRWGKKKVSRRIKWTREQLREQLRKFRSQKRNNEEYDWR